MMKETKIWKCKVCGAVMETVSGVSHNPTCCGQAMEEVSPLKKDGAAEKHLPVAEKVTGGLKVSVGSVPHPMTEEHHIVWIEVLYGDGHVCRRYLQPGEEPEAWFCREKGVKMREFCNLHGLWETDCEAEKTEDCDCECSYECNCACDV